MEGEGPRILKVFKLSDVGEVESSPLLLALNENAFSESGFAALAPTQYTLPFQYAGVPRTPAVATGISCTMFESLPRQAGTALTQYFPILLRSIRNNMPSLPICVRSCCPEGSFGSNTNPPEPKSPSPPPRLLWS